MKYINDLIESFRLKAQAKSEFLLIINEFKDSALSFKHKNTTRQSLIDQIENFIKNYKDYHDIDKYYKTVFSNEVGLLKGKTLLISACLYAPQYIDILLKNGADINGFTFFKRNPLMEAIDFGCFNPELIQFLIDKGADINIANQDNMTPLIKACLKKDSKNIAILLLDGGADIDKKIIEIDKATKQIYDKYTVLEFLYKKDKDLGQFADSYVQNKKMKKSLENKTNQGRPFMARKIL